MANVTFVIGDHACAALHLDDPSDVRVDRVFGRHRNRITVPVEYAEYLANLAADMGAPSRGGEGWDIGAAERRACAVASERIRAAIRKARGEEVR